MSPVLAGLLLAVAPGSPDPPGVELHWHAPPGCPDADGVRARLRALTSALPAASTVRVDARVIARPHSTWRLRLRMRGSGLDDRRVIDAGDCFGLADVTALLIALALAPGDITARVLPDASGPALGAAPPPPGPTTRDLAPASGTPAPPKLGVDPTPASPGSTARETEPRHPGAREPTAPALAPPNPTAREIEPRHPGARKSAPSPGPTTRETEPRPPRAIPRPVTPRPPTRLRGALRLGVGGEVGAIPAWSPTGALTGALLGRRWRLELTGSYAARRLRYAAPDDVGARILLASASLRGCGVPRWRRLEFPVCGGLELGLLSAVARGVPRPRPAGDLWLAAQLSPGLTWSPTPRLALTLTADILVALNRPGFHVTALPELARALSVGLRPLAGVEARFP